VIGHYQAEEAAMVLILKTVGVMSGGFVLCLSLTDVSQARQNRGTDPCLDRKASGIEKCGAPMQQGIRTITGEVLHSNGARLLVKQTDGEEVIYQIDLSTQIGGRIRPGSRIEAKVNEVEGERHAISLDLVR
jgi:hypothetical protein